MKLSHKVALITGAGSGIGQAAAILFAKEGAYVTVIDINSNGRRDGEPHQTKRRGSHLHRSGCVEGR